jgi:8-oxo-dGTP diphosphatase
MKKVTLLFLLRDNQILLAMKKRGFGVGKWNGCGGKAEPGESIEQAAIREAQEEIGVTPLKPEQVGEFKFYMSADPDFCHHAHIFIARAWNGEPHETEEMRPQWFAFDTIPYDTMWADDRQWLPLLLAGKRFKGDITIAPDDTVEHADIKAI